MRGGVNRQGCAGFTLIEALVVLAVIAVLFSVAIPTYQQYLQRGHRAEAIRAMLEVAACQERVRAASGYYDTTRCAADTGTAAYTLVMEPQNQSKTLEYTVMATPVGKPAQDPCGALYLDQAGTRGIGGDARRATACWSGR